jgi:ferredoxin
MLKNEIVDIHSLYGLKTKFNSGINRCELCLICIKSCQVAANICLEFVFAEYVKTNL